MGYTGNGLAEVNGKWSVELAEVNGKWSMALRDGGIICVLWWTVL